MTTIADVLRGPDPRLPLATQWPIAASTVSAPPPARTLTHRTSLREQVLAEFAAARAAHAEHDQLFEVAVSRVTKRLDFGRWEGDCLMPVRWKIRRTTAHPGGAARIGSDAIEYLILSILARTWPAAQFSVTQRGRVFAGRLHGYHHKADRIYVSGLSPILDEVGDLMLEHSRGAGGRFYVQNDIVQLADGRSVLAHLELEGAMP